MTNVSENTAIQSVETVATTELQTQETHKAKVYKGFLEDIKKIKDSLPNNYDYTQLLGKKFQIVEIRKLERKSNAGNPIVLIDIRTTDGELIKSLSSNSLFKLVENEEIDKRLNDVWTVESVESQEVKDRTYYTCLLS